MSAKTQMYDVPREVWLTAIGGRNQFRPSLRAITGESKDDWFVLPMQRYPNCPPQKYAKRQWRIVAKEEAADLEWSFQHKDMIAQRVMIQDPAILRQIAALIGYKESK